MVKFRPFKSIIGVEVIIENQKVVYKYLPLTYANIQLPSFVTSMSSNVLKIYYVLLTSINIIYSVCKVGNLPSKAVFSLYL